MLVSVIQIGNSKGIRLSKTILERYNIRDSVDLVLDKGQIIIKAIDKPRNGWEESFKLMSNNNDDQLMIDDVFEDENPEEWK